MPKESFLYPVFLAGASGLFLIGLGLSYVLLCDQSAMVRWRQCSNWPGLEHVITAELGSGFRPILSPGLKWDREAVS